MVQFNILTFIGFTTLFESCQIQLTPTHPKSNYTSIYGRWGGESFLFTLYLDRDTHSPKVIFGSVFSAISNFQLDVHLLAHFKGIKIVQCSTECYNTLMCPQDLAFGQRNMHFAFVFALAIKRWPWIHWGVGSVFVPRKPPSPSHFVFFSGLDSIREDSSSVARLGYFLRLNLSLSRRFTIGWNAGFNEVWFVKYNHANISPNLLHSVFARGRRAFWQIASATLAQTPASKIRGFGSRISPWPPDSFSSFCLKWAHDWFWVSWPMQRTQSGHVETRWKHLCEIEEHVRT